MSGGRQPFFSLGVDCSLMQPARASAASNTMPRVQVVPYVGKWGGPRNSQERVVPVILLLGLNCLLQVVDAYSTILGLSLGGKEANPLMAAIMATGGTGLFLVTKVAVIAGLSLTAVLVARRRTASLTMQRAALALAIFVLVVIMTNTVQIAAALL